MNRSGNTVGRVHRYALTATAALATLGVMNGSALLTLSGGLLIAVLFVFSGQLLNVERSKARLFVVHGLTLLGLAFAVASFPSSRIDAGLVVVKLGVFNRFVLRVGHRDDLLIIGASSVLLAAATIITPGVVFFVIIVFFVPSVLWALTAGMLLALGERSERGPAGTNRVLAMAGRPAPRSLGAIAWAGLGLTLAGYIVVSLMPRHSLSPFLRPGFLMALPGASNKMSAQTGGVNPRGPKGQAVLRIEPHPEGTEASVSGLYARMFVLDKFDGQTWSGERQQSAFPLLSMEQEPVGLESAWEKDDPRQTVRVTLERTVRRNAPQPIVTVGRVRPSEVSKRFVRRNLSGTWLQGESWKGGRLIYKAYVDRPIETFPLPKAFQPTTRDRLLSVPELDSRVVALADQLFTEGTTVAEKVDAVLKHFRRGFSYSLKPLPGTSEDPLVRFLFEAKEGHCELYASAVAVLLRLGGVKARVATGYYAGWWNALGRYVEFTGEDAHAWVEVEDENGWRWIDATPGDLRSRRSSRSVAVAWVKDMIDAVEAFWFRHVIDFDEDRRRSLVASASRFFTARSVSAVLWDEEGGEGEQTRSHAVRAPGWIFLGALLVVAAFYFIRRGQRARPDKVGRHLRRVLGEQRGENLPLEQLLERVPDAVRPEALRCVGLYQAWRFGSEGGPGRAREILRLLKGVERQSR